ncbi:MAG: DUF433 domain-containing protein [Flavobacteriales bacterium]|nr:DUF433 domain-containing protein [Flavobacteriales bacterium]
MIITDHIEINPEVMMGKPVIRGTRITVQSILEKLGAGEKEEDILQDYPKLTQESIKAALIYAAHHVSGDITFAIAS